MMPSYENTKRHLPVPQLPELHNWYHDTTRFQINHAGRRSYKTELIKRRTVSLALNPHDEMWGSLRARTMTPRYCFSAPVFNQVKRIYWRDLIDMIPTWAFYPNKDRGVSHSELIIRLRGDVEIFLAGMDKPERIEGPPLSGIVMDEYGNMKKDAWGAHVRPALADIDGWAAFVGVPEGMNHYYETVERAEQHIIQRRADDLTPNWSIHHWHSKIVLSEDELQAAMDEMDIDTFNQEFGGQFVYFRGRIYYVFNKETHASQKLTHLYNPDQPIDLSLDFNVEPGVAAISQEMMLPGQYDSHGTPITGTGVIGEVWIPKNSNTPMVCKKFHTDWKDHRGLIYVYGDSTGGSRGTAKTEGSDWEIVQRELRRLFKPEQIRFRVKKQNPNVVGRVNSVNSRLLSSSGIVRMMVDPIAAPHVVKDFAGVRRVEGGSGEIDKKSDPDLTHLSDGLGYRIEYSWPVTERTDSVEQAVM